MNDDNIVAKVMRTTVLNAFMSERNPMYSVNRTLNAIDNIADRCQKTATKEDNMKQLAKVMAAEITSALTGKEPETPVEDKPVDQLTEFMKQQSKVNEALLAKLK